MRLRELLGSIEQIRKQSDDSSFRTGDNAIYFPTGIILRIALTLANDGATIAVVDLNEEKMKGVAEEVKASVAGPRSAAYFLASVTAAVDCEATVRFDGRHNARGLGRNCGPGGEAAD